MRPIKLNPNELDLIIESMIMRLSMFSLDQHWRHSFDYRTEDISEKILYLSDLSEKIFHHLDILFEDQEMSQVYPRTFYL